MKSLGMKFLFSAAILASLTAPVSADTGWGSVSGYLAATSDYRFRGISQSDRDPVAQGSINWSLPDGFYVGTWTSMLHSGPRGANAEWDIYGGKYFNLGGTDLNVEAYYYAFPDNPGPTRASYYETLAQLSHAFGPLLITGTAGQSPDFRFQKGTAWYSQGTAAYTVNDWVTISGNFGHQWVNHTLPDYSHWDIGTTVTWHKFVLDARYVDTDLSAAQCGAYMFDPTHTCQSGAVVSLTYNITLAN
jgi:uncharacterized protein (TIGR02001 family)